jgi:large subunit ribosomal protein L15
MTTASKRKKVVKQRGRRTHGYGSPKKHRGKGSRGGRGMAGSEKHRKSFILKYARERIGKTGFKPRTGRILRTISIRTLASIAGKEKKIDLEALGYDKVLGDGEIKKTLEVKARCFSASAREKIEKAGGKAVATVQPKAEQEVPEEPAEGAAGESVEPAEGGEAPGGETQEEEKAK